MALGKALAATICMTLFLGAEQVPDDPVVRAIAQRGPAADGDLPPVPRTVIEPPQLPPPESHIRDTRKASRVRKTVVKTSARSRAKAKPKTATAQKKPVKSTKAKK